MNPLRHARRIVVALALAWGVAELCPSVAGDDLLYVVKGDGRIVFTNTAEDPAARPVPGFAGRVEAIRRSGAMPATAYDDFIERLSRDHAVPADLIKAVAMVESNLNPRAVSPKGAQGLMQLMPATGRRYGLRNAFDPLENLRAGTEHLRDLLDEFNDDVTLALAAYNAGSGAVRRHGGVPAYRETQRYVDKVRSKLEPGALPTPAAEVPGEPVRMEVGEGGTLRLVN